MKQWFNKIIRYFFLILFLAYYGSITLFTHSHVYNDHIIVHSHPYKSAKGDSATSHQHTEKGFLLIHALSDFLTTLSFLVFIIEAVKIAIQKVGLPDYQSIFHDHAILHLNGLRAPPV